jgi:hypothetical protein
MASQDVFVGIDVSKGQPCDRRVLSPAVGRQASRGDAGGLHAQDAGDAQQSGRDQLAGAVIPLAQFLCSTAHRFSVPTCDLAPGAPQRQSNGAAIWSFSEALAGDPVGIAETEPGDWLVRFADVEPGIIDRKAIKWNQNKVVSQDITQNKPRKLSAMYPDYSVRDVSGCADEPVGGTARRTLPSLRGGLLLLTSGGRSGAGLSTRCCRY